MEDITAIVAKAFAKAMRDEDTVRFPGGFGVYMEDDECELPSMFSVIYDGDLTAVTWDDGSVTRTHRREDDEYDPLFGTLACVIRKLTNNEGHGVDLFEPEMRLIADFVEEYEDLDYLHEYYATVVDAIEVMQNSKGKWLGQLGPRDTDTDEPETEEPETEEREVEHDDVVATKSDLDALRQEIRNLVDAGEL